MPIGPVTLARMVIEELRLPPVLDSMKRNQGAFLTDVTVALVSHAMQMQGLSINRMEDILEPPQARDPRVGRGGGQEQSGRKMQQSRLMWKGQEDVSSSNS